MSYLTRKDTLSIIIEGVPDMDDKNVAEIVKYLKPIIVLQVQNLTKTDEEMPEILLSRVGLQSREIAQLVGKNQGAVAKTIQRAGKGA